MRDHLRRQNSLMREKILKERVTDFFFFVIKYEEMQVEKEKKIRCWKLFPFMKEAVIECFQDSASSCKPPSYNGLTSTTVMYHLVFKVLY